MKRKGESGCHTAGNRVTFQVDSALDELEHRPLVSERFPAWEARIQYWDIGDVELLQPSKVQVDALLAALSQLTDESIAR